MAEEPDHLCFRTLNEVNEEGDEVKEKQRGGGESERSGIHLGLRRVILEFYLFLRFVTYAVF